MVGPDTFGGTEGGRKNFSLMFFEDDDGNSAGPQAQPRDGSSPLAELSDEEFSDADTPNVKKPAQAVKRALFVNKDDEYSPEEVDETPQTGEGSYVLKLTDLKPDAIAKLDPESVQGYYDVIRRGAASVEEQLLAEKIADCRQQAISEDRGAQKKPKIKLTGGRAALPKRITAVLDAEDLLICQLKDKNFSDQAIADKITASGGTRYDMKTIASRYQRIKHAQADCVDRLLAYGLKHWSSDEDALLMEAYDRTDALIETKIQREFANRFRTVSEELRRLNTGLAYSEKACRDRYIALVDGTASIPVDVHDDPEEQLAEDRRRVAAAVEGWEREQIRRREIDEASRRALESIREEEARIKQQQVDRKRRTAEEKFQRAAEAAKKLQEKAERALQDQAMQQRKAEALKRKAALGVVETVEGGKQTSADPRHVMAKGELVKLAEVRGLRSTGTKEDLLVRIALYDARMTMEDLEVMCGKMHIAIPAEKTKQTLMDLIAAAEAKTHQPKKSTVASSSKKHGLDSPAKPRKVAKEASASTPSSYCEPTEEMDVDDE